MPSELRISVFPAVIAPDAVRSMVPPDAGKFVRFAALPLGAKTSVPMVRPSAVRVAARSYGSNVIVPILRSYNVPSCAATNGDA